MMLPLSSRQLLLANRILAFPDWSSACLASSAVQTIGYNAGRQAEPSSFWAAPLLHLLDSAASNMLPAGAYV